MSVTNIQGNFKQWKHQHTDTGLAVEENDLASTFVGHEIRAPWRLLVGDRTITGVRVLRFVDMFTR